MKTWRRLSLTASQLRKSCSRRLREIKDMETQMFLKKERSGFWKKHLDCVPWPTREKGRKEVEMNRGILRGGKTAV